METIKPHGPKLPDMIMCGDHPAITKTELNVKEAKVADDKEKEKEIKPPLSYARISPCSSRDKPVDIERARLRAASEHALKAFARPRPRSLEVLPRPELTRGNRELVQALGSFRWPPYLVCVWVLVLVLTHALHCIVAMLEKALPTLRKLCQYFRAWTEESWKRDVELNQRLCPCALAGVTALLYCAYCALVAARALALWAVQPLGDADEPGEERLPAARHYVDELATRPPSAERQ